MKKFNIEIPPMLEPILELLLQKSAKLNLTLKLGDEYNFEKHPFTTARNILNLKLGPKVSKKTMKLYDEVLGHSNALYPFFQVEIDSGFSTSDVDKKTRDEIRSFIKEEIDTE